ncbi:MAG: hypothetical protein CMF31_01650 [Kordiimonas sp.]|nr:hypothetical protein [Kordiimonas sp.]
MQIYNGLFLFSRKELNLVNDTTARLELPYIFTNQSQKEITHNEALERLDWLVQTKIESAQLTVPPVSPEEGQCWVVATGGSGEWSGKETQIARWQGTGWVFHEPIEGQNVWASDRQIVGRFVSGSWQWGGSPIADAIGGSVVDVEARAVLSTLLNVCRTQGLIED